MGTTGDDTVTAQGKKRILGSITDFLKSNKRPSEISTPHDPLHPTHVGSDPPTDKFVGLPKDWQQLLEDSGISKSDQEKVVMEIVKVYLKDAPASGSSRSASIPGATHVTYPGVSESVDGSFVPAVGVFLCGPPQLL
jgi:hypothetical protein